MKTEMKKDQAFVFDAYGTLFDVHSVIAAVDQKFPGHGPAVSSAWRVRQLEYTWLRSMMNRYEDFWKVTESALVATCNAMKLRLDAATRADLMDAYLHLACFPEAKLTLSSLRNIPLAILSNGSPKMLTAVVETAGLKGIFSEVISVDEVKSYKPNPAVYQLAVQKLRIDKTNIHFVSSNFWDSVGAKAFGFRTYWVNRSGGSGEELGIAPDFTLGTLTDLLAAIE
jgi:2-haloacid dehalogenase